MGSHRSRAAPAAGFGVAFFGTGVGTLVGLAVGTAVGRGVGVGVRVGFGVVVASATAPESARPGRDATKRPPTTTIATTMSTTRGPVITGDARLTGPTPAGRTGPA